MEINTVLLLTGVGIGIVILVIVLQKRNYLFDNFNILKASNYERWNNEQLRTEYIRVTGTRPPPRMGREALLEGIRTDTINADLDNNGRIDIDERNLTPQKVSKSYKFVNGQKVLDRVTLTAKPIVQAPRSMFHKLKAPLTQKERDSLINYQGDKIELLEDATGKSEETEFYEPDEKEYQSLRTKLQDSLEAPFSLLRRNKAPEAKFRNLHPRGSVIVANEKEGDYETTIGSKNTFQIREAKAIQKSDSELVIKGTTKGGQPFAVYGKVKPTKKGK